MKTLQKILLVIFTSCALNQAKATDLLSYWDFNNDSPVYGSSLGSLSTTGTTYGEAYVQTSGSTVGSLLSNTGNGTIFNSSAIKIDFSGMSTIAHATINGKAHDLYTSQDVTSGNAGYGVFADSAVNRASTDSTTGGSLLLLNTAGNAINTYITFSLSSLGYNNLTFSYATRLTNTVASSQVWTYSTDGTNFSTLATITPTANATFITESLNLSTLSSTALDNLSSFYLRVTYTSPNSQGSQAYDNVQLTGLAVVPEPSTWAMMAGGLGMLAFGQRMRRRLQA